MLNKSTMPVMIYGANGYSAGLIIEELLEREVKPVLAGRNKTAIEKLGEKYKLDVRIFDADNKKEAVKQMADIHTVINCAGPFINTAEPMIKACIESKTNYLDLTGEIQVIEMARGYDGEAKEAGIIILPSVGFDVIPTDCLAARLKSRMTDATRLKLGFLNKKAKISRGTLLTTLAMIKEPAKIRRDAKIIDSPIGKYTNKLKEKGFGFWGISIPWGDVSSAFYSTGIPDIEVYMGLPKPVFMMRKFLISLNPLLKLKIVNSLIEKLIKKYVTGPNEKERNATKTYVLGEVSNIDGNKLREVWQVMEGYDLTQKGAALSLLKIFNEKIEPGTHTPSTAFGHDFLESFVYKKII